jgi:hypothetical protein
LFTQARFAPLQLSENSSKPWFKPETVDKKIFIVGSVATNLNQTSCEALLAQPGAVSEILEPLKVLCVVMQVDVGVNVIAFVHKSFCEIEKLNMKMKNSVVLIFILVDFLIDFEMFENKLK